MPPPVAAILWAIIFGALLYLDRAASRGASPALWLPVTWMFLAGSRYVSHWLNLGAPEGTDAQLDGSLVDRTVFSLIILLGLWVLGRRRIRWVSFARQNIWVCLFFLFALASVGWSDYPDLSFKRLLKALGNVVMALVILTDPSPRAALGLCLRRLAYLTLPLSVLFMKYYPDLGRAYHMGQSMFTGVAMQKNTLGQLCLITGTYLIWALRHGSADATARWRRYRVDWFLLGLALWLLYVANSATAVGCLVVVTFLVVVGGSAYVRRAPRRFGLIVLACMVTVATLQGLFDVYGYAVAALGRDPTLTTRVPMWMELLASVRHPLIGYGFESFWATDAGRMVTQNWAGIRQAHNGYIEVYLDLGWIGLTALALWLLAGLLTAISRLSVDPSYAVLQFSFIIVAILYNYTEASFRSVSNIWLLLLVCTLTVYTAGTPPPAMRRLVRPPNGDRLRRLPSNRRAHTRP